VIHLGDNRVWEPATDGDSAELWEKIEKYVADFDEGEEDDDTAAGIGGEIWPAAVAMCNWMANHTDAIKGSRVLELGSGTGSCGLYAAGLGAGSVLLTDGGSVGLQALCAKNVESNRHLYSEGAHVASCPLRWGADSPQADFEAALAALDGERMDAVAAEADNGAARAFDWIIASDVRQALSARPTPTACSPLLKTRLLAMPFFGRSRTATNALGARA
jgi:predicted nicotinamide N-methyase